ncbi:zinc finger protein 496-like isoform X2 [Sceloporus undulatus]|uniref:zinc finger protein 496-like isoform X2 n=1 Tax=Sceloporus undulatus TaxID=8520 RepID=UPI001C4B84DC|nr:zinc finger protein 496-like isoform X2 [Sceloporus undulatus]
MSLQYVKSQKGRDQLLYKGYLHRKERASGGKVLWKCADHQKLPCTGRVHTRGGQVVKYFPHRHPPDETAGKTKRRACGPKETAASQESVAVTPNCETSLGALAKKKPCTQNNPKQTIQRLRACLNALRQSTSDLRTPTPAKEPPSTLPQPSPGWTESPREGTVEEICKATPVPHEETSTCHSSLSWAHQEAGRLRFRTSPVPPGKAPQEVLSRLSEAAQQWLCPQEHSKEQIVDMVILEQFLDMLPVDMRTWVRAQEPGSSKEAAQLAEGYFKERPTDHTVQDQITFDDVSVGFTADEWDLLSHREKTLYWNVMHQNYDNVACLGSGPDGKSEEMDSWQQMAEPVVEMSEKHGALSPNPKQDLIRENCMENQQKNSSGKEGQFVYFREALRKLVRGKVHPDTELRQESWCLYTDCEKQSESTVFLDTQKGPIEEDPELILPGELHELSEQKNLQNLEHNSVREGQNSTERQNSNHLEMKEDKSVVLKKWLWDPFLQDVRPGDEVLHIVIDDAQQNKSLNHVSNEKIHNGGQADCAVLPEDSLEMSEEISQNPEQDLLPDPVHISSKYSPTELNEIAGLTTENQKKNSVKSHQASSSGREKHQEKPILFGNTSEEHAKEMFHPFGQLSPEIQRTCIDCGDQEEISEHVDNQKTSCGKDLNTYLKCEKLLSQNLEELSWSESGGNSSGLSISTKCKKNGGKEKYFNRRSTCVKSLLGAHERIHARRKSQKLLNWENQSCYRPCSCRLPEGEKGLMETSQYYSLKPYIQTCEALHLPIETVKISSEVNCSVPDPKGLACQQRSSSPPLLNKVDTEPSLAQLIGVLQQVAADTAEIKSAVSNLHTTITGIQNALGSLSGCTDEAEHRISNLEDTSRNTKAQLVQHCNDIKAIEAKLGGKFAQTNVIAGLWSSLKITRGASPLNLSPNS